MVGTILPIVYRDRKAGRRSLIGWWHLIGGTLGGLLLGLAVGLVGEAAGSSLQLPWAAIVPVAGALALHELGFVKLSMPQAPWQVPAAWTSWRYLWLTSVAYGVGLGFGVLTRVPTYTFYALLVGVGLASDVLLAVTAGGAYGATRTSWVAWFARHLDARKALREASGLMQLGPVIHLVSGLVLVAVAGLSLGSHV